MPIQQPWLDENPWYSELPVLPAGAPVRCPTRNPDGSEIARNDVRGCGSTNVSWDGTELYDCHDCGIFFTDYAADPPHRRDRDGDGDGAPCPRPEESYFRVDR